jgi:hypothetical protein
MHARPILRSVEVAYPSLFAAAAWIVATSSRKKKKLRTKNLSTCTSSSALTRFARLGEIQHRSISMGIQDWFLFGRKWKHSDPAVRCAAVEDLADVSILSEIAKCDTDASVRLAAVARLTDQVLLLESARNDYDASVRQAAATKITDRTFLAGLVDAKDVSIRLAAVARLADQALLLEWARNDSDASVRQAAAAKITDQTFLAGLVRAKDVNIRTAAVTRLTDQALLSESARNDEDERVRRTAVAGITDQVLLAQIARTDGNRDVRNGAAGGIHDQALLAELVRDGGVWEDVREVALARMTDQQQLATVVAECRNDAYAHEALAKLTDEPLLAQLSKTDSRSWVRQAAVARVLAPKLLVDVALTSVGREVRKLATKRLAEPELLTYVAKSDTTGAVCAVALECLADEAAKSALLSSLSQDQKCRALACLTDSKVIGLFADKDPDPSGREAARARLADLSKPSLVREALRSIKGSPADAEWGLLLCGEGGAIPGFTDRAIESAASTRDSELAVLVDCFCDRKDNAVWGAWLLGRISRVGTSKAIQYCFDELADRVSRAASDTTNDYYCFVILQGLWKSVISDDDGLRRWLEFAHRLSVGGHGPSYARFEAHCVKYKRSYAKSAFNGGSCHTDRLYQVRSAGRNASECVRRVLAKLAADVAGYATRLAGKLEEAEEERKRDDLQDEMEGYG